VICAARIGVRNETGRRYQTNPRPVERNERSVPVPVYQGDLGTERGPE
jgi:hypothetical protein